VKDVRRWLNCDRYPGHDMHLRKAEVKKAIYEVAERPGAYSQA
jgi:hypothetical protein